MAPPNVARATARAGGAVRASRLAELAAEVAARPSAQAAVQVEKAKRGLLGTLTDKQVAALQRKAANGEQLSEVEEQLLRQIPDTGDDVADLTDAGGAEQVSGVDESAIDLGSGASGLRPNKAKQDPVVSRGEQVWQATTPSDIESQSQQTLKRLLREAQKYRTEDGRYDPAFLAKFPSGSRPEEALARLQVLEKMAGVKNADRAAEQIDTAAQARDVASAPRAPAADVNVAAQNMQAAKQLAGEALPAGDWGALTTAFNNLDDGQRQAVLAALPVDTRRFLTDMLDPSQPSPAFLPNRVAERTRPINDVDDLVAQRRAAIESGDQATADEITQLLTGPGAAPQEDITDAIRAFNERQQAATALRNAMIGSDETVQGEQAALRRASVAPAPKPSIAPGARTPEFAADEVPLGEMPTAYDSAQAGAREALLAKDARAPGSTASEAVRLASAKQYLLDQGVDPGVVDNLKMADLPLFLRGEDGSIPFESRSQGSRADYVSPTGQQLLANAGVLQDNVNSAYAALDAVEGIAEYRASLLSAAATLDKAEASAARATGAASLARASQKVDAARSAYVAAVKSNQQGEAALRAIDEAHDALDGAIPGVSRNLTIYDRKLNKAGQAETYTDLVGGALGFRNAPVRGLNRTSTGLDPSDARRLSEQAVGEYGDDAAGLVDDVADADSSVSPNRSNQDESGISIQDTGGRKKSRLGGAKQESRATDSTQRLMDTKRFGPFNPLRITDPATGKPLFADAGAVADEILSKETTLKPGTPSYDIARADLARQIEKQYKPNVGPDPNRVDLKTLNDELDPPPPVPAAPKVAPSQTTAADSPPVQSADAGSQPPVEGADVSAKLDASATDLGADPPAPKVDTDGAAAPPVDGDTPGMSAAELKAEGERVYKEAYRRALDDGMVLTAAKKEASAARKAFLADQKANPTPSKKPATTNPKPAAASNTTDGTAPKVEGDTPAADTTVDDAARTADKPTDTSTSPAVEDADAPKAEADAGTPTVKDDTPTPAPAPPPPKKSLLNRIGTAAKIVGGLTAGGIIVSNLGGGGAGGGGGGGNIPDGIGGGGGGDFFPIPVSSGSTSVVDEIAAAASEEDRINRALERIRDGRGMSRPSSQTVQQYNAGWR